MILHFRTPYLRHWQNLHHPYGCPCYIWYRFCVLLFITGDFGSDRYDDEPKKNRGRLEEIDDWDRGSKKSVAEEALGKVKELWNRTRGFDEPPDYGYAAIATVTTQHPLTTHRTAQLTRVGGQGAGWLARVREAWWWTTPCRRWASEKETELQCVTHWSYVSFSLAHQNVFELQVNLKLYESYLQNK